MTNTENFASNQISLILNKVHLTKKIWHGRPFTRIKFIYPFNFDEIFVRVNTAANISLPKFI